MAEPNETRYRIWRVLLMPTGKESMIRFRRRQKHEPCVPPVTTEFARLLTPGPNRLHSR